MTRKLRNIGISAHVDAGKTTLTERILFYSGRIHRMGEVHRSGGATMDHDDLEATHGITISSAVTQVTWDDHTLNIIDTPGHVDFTVEVERSLRVLDGAILVLCGVGGVQSQSLTVDRQMKRYGVPRIAFINKLDRRGAEPERVVRELADKLRTTPVVLQRAVFSGDRLDGLIDLLSMQYVRFTGDHGEHVVRTEIPLTQLDAAAHARQQMLDTLSLFDDDLLQQLLQDEEPSAARLQHVIRSATLAQQLTPVLLGSAYHNQGVQQLLDAVNAYLPAPAERKVFAHDNSTNSPDDRHKRQLSAKADAPAVAMAFKTVVESFGQLTFLRVYQGTIRKGETLTNARTGNRVRFSRLVRIHADQRQEITEAAAGDIVGVVGVDCASGDTFHARGISCSLENIFVPDPVVQRSITPVDQNDADTLSKALERFRRQDPTFRITTDSQTGETLMAGMGQLHLSLYVERLQKEYGCECEVGSPRVAWLQRPTTAVEFNHRLSKQTGGPGQVGQVIGRMEPLPNDAEETFVFVDEVTGGRIPREYIPAIRKGFAEALSSGPLGDFPVVGVKVVLQDGSFHEQDSSDRSFRDCAREAMRKQILPHADVVRLEPVMQLQIEVPEEFQGSVIGHLSRHRGVVKASATAGGQCSLAAEAPLAELFDYATQLRSLTQGQGSFVMELLGYRPTNLHSQPAMV